jgi:hypothetical protein
MGAPITGGLINNYGMEIVPLGGKLTPDCLAGGKSDIMGYAGPKGLPGLSGGRRRHRQSGGRYGFAHVDPQIVGGAPWASTYPTFSRIAAETGTQNTYNPGPHALVTQPPLIQGGGAQPLTGASLGGDNLAYYAPTAGYASQAGSAVNSVGAPIRIEIPYEAKAMNQACLKTGGGRSMRRKSKKSKSKSKKSKKANRR